MADEHYVPLPPETISHRVLRIVQAWLPVLTVVVGALWGLYTFLAHEKEAAEASARQTQGEAATRAIEAKQPFLKKQLALYYETATIAGKLVTLTPSDTEWHDLERRFYELYWSELAMVEDHSVETAMVEFSRTMNEYKANFKNVAGDPDRLQDARSPLNTAALDLAHAIRASISTQWDTGRQ
jgi:hypothetical protein